MSDVAIRVENLGKVYRIGAAALPYKRISEVVTNVLRSPARFIQAKRASLRAASSDSGDDRFWALKDVSFEIKRGEAVGIIGRNGAGKSTLLKILSRITEPTTGRVELRGRVGSLLEVGTGFHPELTGRENIYLNGTILGMRKAEIAKRFDEIVAFAEVEKFLDTPVKHYSSGMYVRLAFAVAAHLEPEILLVDEVLAVGDAQFQKKCLGKMGEVAREGRTVLFVSHAMPAVLSLCTKGVLLDMGRVRQRGDIQSVVNGYLDEAVALTSKVVFPVTAHTSQQELRFISASIVSDSGYSGGYVSLDRGLTVELAYEVRRPLRTAQIAFEMWNAANICVLSSTDLDSDPQGRERVLEPGRYIATSHIPGAYLRAGRYRLDLSSSIIGIRTLDQIQHAIAFEVVDSGVSAEFKLAQGRRGVVVPLLSWNTRKDSEINQS